jgi:hypothetical protein
LSNELADGGELLTPISPYLLRMEAEHRIAIAGISGASVEYRLTGFEVDGRDEDTFHTSLACTSHHSIAVVAELVTVQMAVGIGYHSRFII